MAKVGIKRAIIGNIEGGGSVKMFSPEWYAITRQAFREANRLSIELMPFNAPGCSQSGGPWIKPEQSMQHLEFSNVETKGPRTFDHVLPLPEQRSPPWHKMRSPFYEDVVVYTFYLQSTYSSFTFFRPPTSEASNLLDASALRGCPPS